MLQRVSHGAQINAATPDEIRAIIEASAADRTENYTRRKGAINLSASGAGVSADEDLKVSSQYDWFCERVTLGGNGAANALVGFYENDVNSDANLLEIVQLGTAGKYSDSFSNNLYVPANSKLLIAVTGGVAQGQITYNIQIKYIKHRGQS